MFFDSIILWLITGIYGVFGLFSLFFAYNILVKRNFGMITKLDENQKRNLKNTGKFAMEHALPHILIGLSCIWALVAVVMYGFSSMLISILITMTCFIYGAYVTKKTPERLRRGRYL